jgi:RNA polymerase sigma-B factor
VDPEVVGTRQPGRDDGRRRRPASARRPRPVGSATAEADRERRLFGRLQDPADPLDVETAFCRYLPLARSIALGFRGNGERLEDLLQVASLGLVKAIRRFEVERGHRFSSFAIPVIRGEILRHLRDATWAVRVGRDQQHLALHVERRLWELATELGRSPTVEELASAVDCSVEDVVDARRALLAHHPASLDGPAEGRADGDVLVVDTLGAEDLELEAVVERSQLEALLERLPFMDREVLRLRVQQGLNQREIGRRVGLSQSRVSRVLEDSRMRLEVALSDAR